MNITKNLRVFLGTCAVTLLIGGTAAQASSIVKKGNWYSYLGCDAQSPNYLMPSYGLSHGACLVSPNGTAIAIYQKNGNFVIYRGSAMGKQGSSNKLRFLNLDERKNKVIIWTSDTWKRHGDALVMQGDGNLVNYAGKKPIWSTGMLRKHAYLVLGDNAHLVLYTSLKGMSNTGAKVKGWMGKRFFGKNTDMMQFVSNPSPKVNKGKIISRGWGGHSTKGVYVTKFEFEHMKNKHSDKASNNKAASMFVNSNCSTKDGVAQTLTANLKFSTENWTRWSEHKGGAVGMAEIDPDAVAKLKAEVSKDAFESVMRGKTERKAKTYTQAVSLTVQPNYEQGVEMKVKQNSLFLPSVGYRLVSGNYRKVGAKTSKGHSPILTRIFKEYDMTITKSTSAHVIHYRARRCS